ncbi:MAG: hypothetical protein WD826_06235 [Actinomycetota bacterium]
MGKNADAVASTQHGVIAKRQALTCGMTTKMIRSRVRSGRWRDAEPGVYVVAGSSSTFEQRCMVAVLGERDDLAGVSHRAAGVLHGVVNAFPARIDVTVEHLGGAHGRRRTKLVHRARSFESPDVVRVAGIPVTCIERTLVDLAGVLDDGELQHALDTSLNRGLTTLVKLERYIRDRDLRCLRGVGRLSKLITDRGDGVPGSGLERAFRRILTPPIPQPLRQSIAGEGRRLDFYFPEYGLFVEVDHVLTHGTPQALNSDNRRQNEIVLATGDVPLRYTEEDIYDEPDRIRAEVELALRQRGWTPPPRRPRKAMGA